MATRRTFFNAVVPPLVMAVLLSMPNFEFTLNAPLLASAVIFLVAFCLFFFWVCVWLSAAIGRILSITRPLALLAVNAVVQFVLVGVISTPVDLALRTFTWSRVFRDGFEQAAAFLIAYLVYLALKRQGTRLGGPPLSPLGLRGAMSILLSPEERRLILIYLKPGGRAPERRLWYVAYVLPSVLFAIYAFWNRDFAAALVAYLALLSVALMYLSYSTRQSEHLRSALEKYEAAVGALKNPTT